MVPVMTSTGMREADRKTIEQIGLPGAVLMENAGSAVARVLAERFPQASSIAVLCGRGNNGGDGFVVARKLLRQYPLVLLFGKKADLKGDARLHMAAFEASGGRLEEVLDPAGWDRLSERVGARDLVVDALLGTGLREAPTGAIAKAIADLASCRRPIVAVDLPSGVSSDS
jgi:hydroxyethylthiazole kinase-like uncharacterized protein yjeF